VIYSRIIGTGGYLPEKILSNADLEKLVDTSDQWIVSRTGIRNRHLAADDQGTCDLAEEAARRALAAAANLSRMSRMSQCRGYYNAGSRFS
jgi:3-oxoacyl-[acyl-carrier-protein] synthase-3